MMKKKIVQDEVCIGRFPLIGGKGSCLTYSFALSIVDNIITKLLSIHCHLNSLLGFPFAQCLPFSIDTGKPLQFSVTVPHTGLLLAYKSTNNVTEV